MADYNQHIGIVLLLLVGSYFSLDAANGALSSAAYGSMNKESVPSCRLEAHFTAAQPADAYFDTKPSPIQHGSSTAASATNCGNGPNTWISHDFRFTFHLDKQFVFEGEQSLPSSQLFVFNEPDPPRPG